MDGIVAIARGTALRPSRPIAGAGPFRLDVARAGATGAAAAPQDVAPPPHPTDDTAARNHRAASRARRILTDLAALQAGILTGAADPAILSRLAESAAGADAADLVLAEALEALSLRAQVELARRGKIVAGS